MRVHHLIAAITAACVLAPTVGRSTTDTVVSIRNFDFGPMTITIPVGGSVTWRNLDEEPHTVVSADGLFRSKALDEGDSFTFTFTKVGDYPYICSIHPQMRAQIVVK